MKVLKTNSWHFKYNKYVSNRQVFKDAFSTKDVIDYYIITFWNIIIGLVSCFSIASMLLGLIYVPLDYIIDIPKGPFIITLFLSFIYIIGIIIWSGVILLLSLFVLGFMSANINKSININWFKTTKLYTRFVVWKQAHHDDIDWRD